MPSYVRLNITKFILPLVGTRGPFVRLAQMSYCPHLFWDPGLIEIQYIYISSYNHISMINMALGQKSKS